MRITDISVRALKGSEKYVTHWDATTPGFGIRVGKRSKTWTVMRGRNRERLTIGRYPDLSVAEARAEAKRLLIAAPEAKAISTTFGLAREEFVEGYQNAGTRYLVTRLLRLHFKAIEKSALSDITDDEISRALAKLSDRPSEQLHAQPRLHFAAHFRNITPHAVSIPVHVGRFEDMPALSQDERDELMKKNRQRVSLNAPSSDRRQLPYFPTDGAGASSPIPSDHPVHGRKPPGSPRQDEDISPDW